MGRKTRREKVMAEYRRKIRLLEEKQPERKPEKERTEPAGQTADGTVKYRLADMASNDSGAPAGSVSGGIISKADYKFVVSDLIRILFLTALAICAQLVLWYKYR